jgi:hypothetical protein
LGKALEGAPKALIDERLGFYPELLGQQSLAAPKIPKRPKALIIPRELGE